MANKVAHVAFPFRGSFDYAIPDALSETIVPGSPVIVPLGPRKLVGYVIAKHDDSKHKLRPIERVPDDIAPLPADLLKLAHFMSGYYMVEAGDVIRMIVPTPMRRTVIRHYLLSDAGKSLLKTQTEHPIAVLRKKRTLASIRTALKLSAKETLLTLDEWIAQGFVVAKERLSIGSEVDEGVSQHTASVFVPRHEQAAALVALHAAREANAYKGFLLWGVTGSGKTEVYLAAISETLRAGKTAIVLVPEIGLTPQLEARFRARFSDDVVTIHSGLSVKQRRAAWARVQAGAARVVVGPRSALFAPLQSLGMVIVDEEHDDSYKQDEMPRYHARDLALVRAQLAGAVAVLGSATPSLETLQNVATGKLTELRMRERASGGTLPKVEIVRIGKEKNEEVPAERRIDQTGRHVRLFTPRLTELVLETVARQEQVILFLNRRGFAPFVVCQGCGHGFKCEQCSVSLTHHMRSQTLRCHYCDHSEPTPLQCPQCRSHELRVMGTGTERLEIELQRFFPNFRVGRLDRDVAHDAETLEKTLALFRSGELDILVGTQMVTKGHDFPLVTLVGVLVADASLNFPDFRAAERTAQLLVQVAGRSGRADKPGRVVVQTFFPEHPALVAAASHDYEAFARGELVERQALVYPPYNRLILLRFEHSDLQRVTQEAKALAEGIRRAGAEADLLGPAPCPLARLRGDYRMSLLLKCQRPAQVKQALAAAIAEWKKSAQSALIVDVDPVSML